MRIPEHADTWKQRLGRGEVLAVRFSRCERSACRVKTTGTFLCECRARLQQLQYDRGRTIV